MSQVRGHHHLAAELWRRRRQIAEQLFAARLHTSGTHGHPTWENQATREFCPGRRKTFRQFLAEFGGGAKTIGATGKGTHRNQRGTFRALQQINTGKIEQIANAFSDLVALEPIHAQDRRRQDQRGQGSAGQPFGGEIVAGACTIGRKTIRPRHVEKHVDCPLSPGMGSPKRIGGGKRRPFVAARYLADRASPQYAAKIVLALPSLFEFLLQDTLASTRPGRESRPRPLC